MTKEEKDLLLKDLCARLPYGVKVQPRTSACPHRLIGYDKGCIRIDTDQRYELESIKPYLRPMSSMTEEEMDKYNEQYKYSVPYFTFCGKVADYLDSIYIDHRTIRDEDGKEKTMIELGLALEAPADMYK